MSKIWTNDNTERFSAAELVILNTAQRKLERTHPELTANDVADLLNNSWVEDSAKNTVEQLIARVEAR